MSREPFNVWDAEGGSKHFSCKYIAVPRCPSCNCIIDTRPRSGFYVEHIDAEIDIMEYSSSYDVYMAFFCTHCRNMFMAKYYAESSDAVGALLVAREIAAVYPTTGLTTEFPQTIQTCSPMFVTTYNQSEKAENLSLFEIAGCGYRKSLEYLVKDYLCYKTPDDVESIKAEFLGKSIKRITDTRIQTLAERSAWIGNDKTHYVEKFQNLDIADMKRFITALVHFLDCELTFEEALAISSNQAGH